MGKAIVRELQVHECERVLRLWKLVGSRPTVTDTVEYLRDLIIRDGGMMLVAESAGEIVGTVMGGWDGWRGHIYRLAVHPDFRRRGIARALLGEIELRLRSRGARRIYALSETSDGIRFWRASEYEATADNVFVRTY